MIGRCTPRQQGVHHRAAAGFMFAMVLANGGNLVFHLVASRRLGLDHYGALASTLAVLVTITVPLASLQVAVTREVATQAASGVTVSVRRWLLVGVAVSIVGAAAVSTVSGVVADVMNLSSGTAVRWLAAYAPAALVTAIGRGVLLGRQRISAISAIVVGTAIARVMASVVLLSSGDTEVPALVITVGAEYLLAAALVVAMRANLRSEASAIRLSRADIERPSTALAGVWILLSLDLVIAQGVLDAEQVARFAAAALGARAALFIPQSLAHLVHARVASAPFRESQPVVDRALTLTVAFGIANVVVLVAIGPWLVTAGLGAAFAPSRILIGLVAGAAALIATANLLVHVRLAIGRSCRQVWIAAPATAAAAMIAIDDPVWIATSAIIGAALAVHVLDPTIRLRDGRSPTDVGAVATDRPDVAVVASAPLGEPAWDRLRSIHDLLIAEGFEVDLLAPGVAWDPAFDGWGSHERIPLPFDLTAAPEASTAHRWGLEVARADAVVVLDPNRPISPSTVVKLVRNGELFDADLVVASRRHPASPDRDLRDRLATHALRSWSRTLFGSDVGDPTSGMWCLRGTTLDLLRHDLPPSGSGFLPSVAAHAARLGCRRIVESPVTLDGVEPFRGLRCGGRVAVRLFLDRRRSHRPRHEPVVDVVTPGGLSSEFA